MKNKSFVLKCIFVVAQIGFKTTGIKKKKKHHSLTDSETKVSKLALYQRLLNDTH